MYITAFNNHLWSKIELSFIHPHTAKLDTVEPHPAEQSQIFLYFGKAITSTKVPTHSENTTKKKHSKSWPLSNSQCGSNSARDVFNNCSELELHTWSFRSIRWSTRRIEGSSGIDRSESGPSSLSDFEFVKYFPSKQPYFFNSVALSTCFCLPQQ